MRDEQDVAAVREEGLRQISMQEIGRKMSRWKEQMGGVAWEMGLQTEVWA